MRIAKLLVATLFAAAAGIASATEWVLVTQDEREIVYVDLDSIHQEGKLKKAWLLRNYSEIQTLGDSFPHRSKLILYVFRCDVAEAGYSQWSFHSGELGSGRTIWAGKTGDIPFIGAAKDPALDHALKEVCSS